MHFHIQSRYKWFANTQQNNKTEYFMQNQTNISNKHTNFSQNIYLSMTGHSPVLKINNHATGGWRTKDILRGPKSLETKKLGSSKGWGDQSAKKTNNWRDKKYLMNRWGTKKLRTYVVGWFCWNLRAFWEDQTDQKSAVGGPKRILRTGWPRHKEPIL